MKDEDFEAYLKKHADEVQLREPSAAAKQLLEEIIPLMKDYFEGEIIFTGRAINYIMPNGKAFIITAREVI